MLRIKRKQIMQSITRMQENAENEESEERQRRKRKRDTDRKKGETKEALCKRRQKRTGPPYKAIYAPERETRKERIKYQRERGAHRDRNKQKWRTHLLFKAPERQTDIHRKM